MPPEVKVVASLNVHASAAGIMEMPMVEIDHVSLWYGEKLALKDISMSVPKHRVTAYIGPSGCGKSTLLRCLNRMNDLVDGVRMAGNTTRKVVSSLVAPSARDASRIPRGIAASPSSVATITTGTVRRASVSEAQRIPPVPKVGLGSASLKKTRSIVPPTT